MIQFCLMFFHASFSSSTVEKAYRELFWHAQARIHGQWLETQFYYGRLHVVHSKNVFVANILDPLFY